MSDSNFTKIIFLLKKKKQVLPLSENKHEKCESAPYNVITKSMAIVIP